MPRPVALVVAYCCRTRGKKDLPLGSENYKDGVQNGDIEERMNSAGKLMAYTRKEKVSGKRETIKAGKNVEKAMEIKVEDYAKFAASIAMEAKAWCKFGLTGDTGDQRL